MRGQRLGSAIGAAFGLVYVWVNSGGLPSPWPEILRVAGVLAALAVLVSLLVSRRTPEVAGSPLPGHPGTAYAVVVVLEVVAIPVGAAVLNNLLDAPQAVVAWVSSVVGTHFFALARVFRQPFFHLLGAGVLACGLVGLLLGIVADTGAEPIAVVAGVVPGAMLLAAAWWGAHRTPESGFILS